ncbi:hypothetical protein [Breznakiella homolactica]|uniref:Prenyltransferase n=1 Tax=Breznakiella homolactica TaxID=2798577 RepID=A0A7T8BB22_9SPIR|nr:hypothetical protein [Breznakiella homolactica]QQO08778.1 hypothetical protein JFL75_17895 [Breznakiella homolactica]
MAVDKHYSADAEAIIARRYDQGADFWTTPDKRLIKGAPFSALESALMLLELGMDPEDPLLKAVADLFWEAWQEDGRFRVYPKGAVFPCQTIHAAALLCRLGYADDPRMEITLRHLLETRYTDGGWRCEKFFFGRGPETNHSNPLPTLNALDVFRYTPYYGTESSLDRAVDFLLSHWETRLPLGPCHYGIGTLFMQVEYPFRNYNLFLYVYVLSFYRRARKDRRFREALSALEDKLADGQIVVERVVPKLAGLSFCRKGEPSEPATKRYREILDNLGKKN